MLSPTRTLKIIFAFALTLAVIYVLAGRSVLNETTNAAGFEIAQNCSGADGRDGSAGEDGQDGEDGGNCANGQSDPKP